MRAVLEKLLIKFVWPYLNSVIGRLAFNKRHLIWDAYKCHICDAVQEECKRMRIDSSVIPGGLTKYIQTADVVWNGPFKAGMRGCYDTWLAEPSLREFTKGGNPRPPQRSLVCNWVKRCWDDIPTSTIRESFVSCAISTSSTGPDIDKIHCLKQGQPCEGGRSKLEEELKKADMVQDVEDDDRDPFGSEEDEDEERLNELWIEEEEMDEGGVDGNSSEQEEMDDESEGVESEEDSDN